ncbi:response regulator transcription factor [Paenibacillus sp. IB182496]|uniref:Response regulator transcription factor n=1 Tax=Paenibacillus sabuli TaxID=2772509 RepID=A0A927BPY6_9BACL|nr:response regulator transcription factor [Paenibacillus sabuli]MBD2843605.1 response regulator transcription factor [Paenibacillus sabuli]
MIDSRILVVDDDPDIRHLICIHLEEGDMICTEARSGKEALELLELESFDLVILDLMMDDTDGLHVLEHVRSCQNHTPIIIVSALSETEKKIKTLGLGADDYITKPFIPSELVARVLANIRRSRSPQTRITANRLQYRGIILNLDSLTIEKEGKRYSITQTECDVLAAFMRKPGYTYTKDELYQAVWNHAQYDPNSLSVYINFLRKKIEANPKMPRYIQTIRGIGYRFAEVKER